LETDNVLLDESQAAVLSKPESVADISKWFLWRKHDVNFYSIGSRDVDKYLTATEDDTEIIMYAIGLMDGTRTEEEISRMIYNKFGKHLDITLLVKKMKTTGLLEGGYKDTSELGMFSKKIISYKFSVFSILKKKIINYVYNIWLIISFVAILAALLTFIFNFNECRAFFSTSFTYKDSYFLGAVLTTVASIINIMLHELSHMAASVKCGLQPSEFNMNLYGGFKLIWMVKIKGMYTIPRKHRIMVMSAGILTNLVLISIVITVCVLFHVNSVAAELMSKIMINNIFMLYSCCMPFNISDGYFIFSQLSKYPNMRTKMFRLMGGRKKDFNIWVLLYSFISVGMIIYGFVLSGKWGVNISIEFYDRVISSTNIAWFAFIAAAVPVIFVAWLNFVFVIKLIKLIKANMTAG